MKYLYTSGLSLLLASTIANAGIYAPAAGKAGSTAISANSSSISGWATGYLNYSIGSDVDTTWRTPNKALGKAGDSGNTGASNYTYDIAVLGNGGSITLTFDNPIANGAGDDFAVFENSFSDTFLELAWVEVSSNGTDFFRFNNFSLTANPVNAFGNVDPTNIDGLAGKYRGGYGTGFDLEALVSIPGLDINNINYVRIVDIIGNGAALDSLGRPIYDPHKTVGSGGFDLDAVGVINYAPEVPVPAAAWLFASSLAVLARRRFAK